MPVIDWRVLSIEKVYPGTETNVCCWLKLDNWGETGDESLVRGALTIAWPHVMICSRYFLRTCFWRLVVVMRYKWRNETVRMKQSVDLPMEYILIYWNVDITWYWKSFKMPVQIKNVNSIGNAIWAVFEIFNCFFKLNFIGWMWPLEAENILV